MGSAVANKLMINRFGLTEVSRPTSAKSSVDIVFVHGLNGDPQQTWTSETTKVFWPAQLLPPILEDQNARILVYGYDADVTSFTDGASKDMIHNHAERLVADLFANRRIRKASERPIIFIAHSLGGLVVKRALIYSSEIRGPKTEHLRSIFVSTYGILFLGTPHKGSDLAEWGSRLEWICGALMPKKIIDSQPQLVDALKSNNETLQNIDRGFIQIMNRYHIYFFHEGKPTNLKGTLRFVVNEASASPTVQDVERAGIQADHSHMCKFDSENAAGFDIVVEGIQRYAEEAPDTIATRWDAEKQERSAAKKAEAQELYPVGESVKETPPSGSGSTTTSTPGSSSINLPLDEPASNQKSNHKGNENAALPSSPQPSEPYSIFPPGFGPNTYFVGMEKELKELDSHLFDKRRRDGTACVLLHGQAGGGKTHLARQYVNKNRKKFPGGMFWINTKLKEELYKDYWNIAQKAVVRDNPEVSVASDHETTPFVDAVRTWFEDRHEWLIVFDGVTVDKEEDVTELQMFIPNSRNSSIIYLSRAKNLETKQRLLRPYAIKVPRLKPDDARKLLFLELHMKKPTEGEIKRANELVKKTEGLPLAIHAITHRLGDTGELLRTFNMKSFSDDPMLGGTYKIIMGDLQRLNHMEAWNLINILSFFGPHIPVEMVNLGLKSLRQYQIDVKSSENGGKPDLNITLGILMRYALIERNEPDLCSVSGSHDSLVDPEPIDILRIHSVVQKFCCDYLSAAELLPQWLRYAVDLFCYSFRQADLKIKRRPEPGRVLDYREYLVHGSRLWENSQIYERKKEPLDTIRSDLQPTLDMISSEIRMREPSSSEESVGRGVFATSIFDKLSSSSDSGPPDYIRTPNHRPTSLILADGNISGSKPVDSPRSFGMPSPSSEAFIFRLNPYPRPPLPPSDDGYESGQDRPSPMKKSASDRTARPSPAHILPIADQNDGWQVVQPGRRQKPRGRRDRRDLGSFRPSPAKLTVDRGYAVGSVTRPTHRGKESLAGWSDAVSSLTAVHRSSPPPPQGGGYVWQWRPSSRPPSHMTPQVSYAGVAARGIQRPLESDSRNRHGNSQFQPPQPLSPVPTSIEERGRSKEVLRLPSENTERSPIRMQSVTRKENHIAAGKQSPFPSPPYPYVHPYHSAPTTVQQPSVSQRTSPAQYDAWPRPIPSENIHSYYNPPPPLGPNSAPLPYDDAITITSKRRFPANFRGHQGPNNILTPRIHGETNSPNNPYHRGYGPPHDRPLAPSGYYSQPLSRDGSHQSRNSAAETEPLRYPPTFLPDSRAISVEPRRDRLPDGCSPRKSPKADYVFPARTTTIPPHDTVQDLSGTGGWTYSTSPNGTTFFETSMSRSSSGPGLAIESPTYGLGIAPFGTQVQFGDHEPISLEEARRRTWERETRLREVEVSRGRRGVMGMEERQLQRLRETGGGSKDTPYPSVDLMPHEGGGPGLGV